MSKNILRTAKYEVSGENDKVQIIKLKKWSIGKLYLMLDSISIVLQKTDFTFGKDSYTSQDIGRIISEAAQAAQTQLTHIILESVEKNQNITEAMVNDLMPEDYIGLLSKILEMNLTEQLVKNLRSLRTAFNPQKQK